MAISGKRKTNHKTQETSIMSQSVVDAYSMDILSERGVWKLSPVAASQVQIFDYCYVANLGRKR